MSANSYYARFKELYCQAIAINDDIKALGKEANADPFFDEDLSTLKRAARIAAKESILSEKSKIIKLNDVFAKYEQLTLF